MPLRLCGSGEIFVGERNTFGYGPAIRLGNGEIMIQARANDAKILIGSDNHFSNNINFVAQASIELGSRCSIGDGVSVYDCDFHELDPTHRNQGVGSIKPVVIGDNVWIGSRVIILKGVTIGENSVVGAMSLVVRSVPPNTVVAGNPARVVRVLT